MRPVHVSVEVTEPPDAVFDFLDVLANHERFTDHSCATGIAMAQSAEWAPRLG